VATVRYPIEYELRPTRLAEGEQWVWLDLQNVSDDPITQATVRLISQDASRLKTKEPDNYVPSLSPDQEQEVGFEVEAAAPTAVYISIAGEWDGAPFRWESPYIQLSVGDMVAEIASLATMTTPYPPVDEPIQVEAVIRALGHAEDLRLELWADTPSGAFERLTKVTTGELNAGDERRYPTAFTPEEKGTHTIYAYLYDGVERIDRRLEHVYVT